MEGSGRRHDAAFAIALGAVLAAYNNIIGMSRWHQRWYTVANVCATAGALSAAAASGLTAADLGLRRDRLHPGLVLGSRLAAAVAGGWLLAASLPATRPALTDQRVAGLRGRQVAYQAGVRIPFGTVLWEEAAFRGVLQAALRRIMPGAAADAVTSGLFGIWHIRPAIEAVRVNRLAQGPRQALTAATTGVAVTTAGGAVLSWLRVRSGSLAAPVLVHLAANSPGVLAAWWASRAIRGRAGAHPVRSGRRSRTAGAGTRRRTRGPAAAVTRWSPRRAGRASPGRRTGPSACSAPPFRTRSSESARRR